MGTITKIKEMGMKTIKKVELSGAEKLTPIEMNKIYFETGRHTPMGSPGRGGAGLPTP